MNLNNFPINADYLLPHRKPMLLLSELKKYDDNYALGSSVFGTRDIFVKSNGYIDEISYIELIAQLVAAYSGYKALINNSKIKGGYLVGIKNFSIHKKIHQDDYIDIEMNIEHEIENLSFVKGLLKVKNEICAKGTIKTWEITENESIPLNLSSQNSSFEKLYKDKSINEILNNHILNFRQNYEIYNENHIISEYIFPKEFIGFGGHFPGYPIFPGILCLKLIISTLEDYLEIPLKIIEIINAKFSSLIFPDSSVKTNIDIEKNDGGFLIRAKILSDNKTAASLQLSISKDI